MTETVTLLIFHQILTLGYTELGALGAFFLTKESQKTVRDLIKTHFPAMISDQHTSTPTVSWNKCPWFLT